MYKPITLILHLLVISALSERVRICGSVFLPDGATLAPGELQVRLTRERLFIIGTDTDTETKTIDPIMRSFCFDKPNGKTTFVWGYRFRLTVVPLVAGGVTFPTGNLVWTAPDGSMSDVVPPEPDGGGAEEDRNGIVDIVFNGSGADGAPLVSFLGLRTLPENDAADSPMQPLEGRFANTMTTTYFQSANLLRNGSFEAGSTGWYNYGWRIENFAAKPKSGSRLALFGVSSASHNDLSSSFFRLEPGEQYTLRFYYRAFSVTGDVRPSIWSAESAHDDAVGSHLRGSDPLVASGDWRLYEHTFTVPAARLFGRIYLFSHAAEASGGGLFAFDEVQMYKTSGTPFTEDIRTVDYFDGFNRALQQVIYDGNKDIVMGNEYDAQGRLFRNISTVGSDFLTTNGRHGYIPDLLEVAQDYYNGQSSRPDAGGFPFSQFHYELAPTARPAEFSSPGEPWKIGGAHSETVYFGSTDDLTPDTDLPPAVAGNKYLYELHKGKDAGELTRKFTDAFGRVIKTGRKSTGEDRWLETTVEYDPNDNPVRVLAPPGFQGQRAELASGFNTFGEMLFESSADKGTMYFLHDRRGLLRFTQSQEQRDTRHSFTYFKYDALRRVVESGEFMHAEDFTPANAENPDFPTTQEHRKPRVLNWYDSPPPPGFACGGGSGNNSPYYLVQAGSPGNSVNVFPTLEAAFDYLRPRFATENGSSRTVIIYQVFNTSLEVAPVTGYEFEALPLATPGNWVSLDLIGILEDSPLHKSLIDTPLPEVITWGPLKGRLVKTLACNEDLADEPVLKKEIAKVFNYDRNGNIIGTWEYNGYIGNADKRWQKTSFAHDRQDRVVRKTVHKGVEAVGMAMLYEYDAAGRLATIRDGDGGSLAAYTHNPIGQVGSVVLGAGPNRLQIDYTYHIQGWMSSIRAWKPATNAQIYAENLQYENSSQPKFNGSISELTYRLAQDPQRLFQYEYDDLNRLTRALFPIQTPNAHQPTLDVNLNEQMTYHDNGSLKTKGKAGGDAIFIYAAAGSNRLKAVQGLLDGRPGYDREFTSTLDFDWDADGNMIYDYSKGLGIFYSGGGAAYKFTLPDNSIVLSAFDETGRRVSKFEVSEGATIAKHYFTSGKEVREGFAQVTELYDMDGLGRAFQDGGSGAFIPEFYVKDHLGSTMLLYNPISGATRYRSEYFPYGTPAHELNNTPDEVTAKFTGKEFDDGTDLAYFGARFFDPDLGIWISPDPVRQYHSPYTYCGNDPINCFDPDGRSGVSKGFKIINKHLAGDVHPVTGIPFKATGYPDFSGVAGETVRFKFTGDRAADFAKANEMAGLSKTPEGMTWHHVEDGETMQLIPTDVHKKTGHTGGVAVVKNAGTMGALGTIISTVWSWINPLPIDSEDAGGFMGPPNHADFDKPDPD